MKPYRDTDKLTGMAVNSETKPGSAPAHRTLLAQQMSAIGARVTRALSKDKGDDISVAETTSLGPDSPINPDRRSVSRGRDAFQSSGRGGIGNIRRSSQSRDARPADGPDDFSPTRGREPLVHPDRIYSVGRGGAGNIRSPSQEPSKDVAEADHQARLVREHAEATTMHSSGRGGAGNIISDRSRSRDPAAGVHSTGRGGAGNIYAGTTTVREEALDEQERRLHAHHDGIHSTGRGGDANITATHEPTIESVSHHHLHGEFESTGRGGAGNIRSRSASRDPGSRAASKDKHGIAAFLDKLSHPHQQHAHVADQSGTPRSGSSDVVR